MKFLNLQKIWTASKNLVLLDTLSRNTPLELFTRKTTVEIPEKKIFLAKDEKSPRLEFKNAVQIDSDTKQIKILEHFPLYLDCQKNQYEVDLLGKDTPKLLP